MKRALLWSAAVLALAAACSRTLLTRFDHRAHLAERPCGAPGQPPCLSCTGCHRGAEASHDRFAPPGLAQCSSCHSQTDERWQHALKPRPLAAPAAGKAIVFSHELHLPMRELKGQCVKCHAGAVSITGTPALFPPMAKCLDCHEHRQQFQAGSCNPCHREQDLRGLRPVSFMSHDAAWTRRHGDSARREGEWCSRCHAQTMCDACHDASRPLRPAQVNPEKLEREWVHRFDFLSRHALESDLQPGQCFTCHQRTECDACHASRGVSAAVRGAANPHPAGWASGLGSNTHGPAARRNLASCAACHDQGPASNCVRCHAVGGFGGNPHPAGFRSTEPLTAPQCAVCHGAGR